jgi:hypothetical protein
MSRKIKSERSSKILGAAGRKKSRDEATIMLQGDFLRAGPEQGGRSVVLAIAAMPPLRTREPSDHPDFDDSLLRGELGPPCAAGLS